MPELPEVESARSVIERGGLKQRIVDVDDSDSWVCRPHPPGEIRAALLGRELTEVHRRGKSMWCETGDGGPVLGIHLGMSGKIVIATADGAELDGGDYWDRGRATGDHRHTRFAITFAGGGVLRLVDPRRLGRVRLDPPVDVLGPDAATITRGQFRKAFSAGTAPVKARFLDQHAIAGVGNLLADQILWQSRIHPARRVRDLTGPEVDRLHRATRSAVAAASAAGGVHTLKIMKFRRPGGLCPRDGVPMLHATIGGRTTYWCPQDQHL
jgi:formamidopyrimidine-DNA glycosylase